jgi:hypothetical protein
MSVRARDVDGAGADLSKCCPVLAFQRDIGAVDQRNDKVFACLGKVRFEQFLRPREILLRVSQVFSGGLVNGLLRDPIRAGVPSETELARPRLSTVIGTLAGDIPTRLARFNDSIRHLLAPR